jgi:tetratricopeptide (TPR) repeat protein
MNSSLGALVIAFVLVSAPSAKAAESSGRTQTEGNVEKARASFQQGVDFFHEGNFEAALAEFRKAYVTAPSYRLLYNIAQSYYELHDYVNALKTYQQYLADGGAEIAASRRAQVEEAAQKLQARIAYLDILVNVAGAEVSVDDVPVGTSPLPDQVAVNPGPRRLSAVKAGLAATAKTITVAGGDHVNLTLEFLDLKAPKRMPSFLQDAETESGKRSTATASRSRVPLITSLVVTGACAATAGVFGWLSLSAKRDFDRDLDTFNVSSTQLDSDRSYLRTYALVTDVAAAATLVAAGFSVYFLVSRSSEPAPQTAVPRPFVALAPTLGGMAVSGGW